jgi:prophage antirepressor-like protein
MVKEYALTPDMAERLTDVERNHRKVFPLTSFNFDNHQIRVFIQNNAFWFVAVDVGRLLGLGRSGAVVFDLDEEDKITILTRSKPKKPPVYYQLVSEYGLFSMVFRSKKPGAKDVSKWLVTTAMPKIRKFYEPSLKKKISSLFRIFTKEAAL